jgi:PAS domain S-box-containing protein
MHNREGTGLDVPCEIAALQERLTAAEAALADREERLLEVQEVAGLGFYIYDYSNGHFTTSEPLDRLFALPADFEKTVESWEQLIHPDDRKRVIDAFRATIVEHRPFDQEYRIYRLDDNQLHWLHGRGRVHFDGDGKPLSVLGTVLDITERKFAEQALKRAHEDLERRVKERTADLARANENLDIFRRFAEDAEEGFKMSDFGGRILYANPALCRLLGEKRAEDVIGRNIADYYPEEHSRRRRSELIPELLRHGHCHVERTILPRNGPPIETMQSAFLIRDADGSPSRIAVVISDITLQKRAEEALRQSYLELRIINESMIDGLIVADLDTAEIVLANHMICQMLGYTEEELLSMSVTAIHLPDDVPPILQRFKERVAGRRISPRTCLLVRKDGGTVPVDIVSNTMPFRGRPCIVGFFRDVTERQRTEEERAKHHRTLKHLLQSSDDERQVIAYEIHDGLAQQLTGAIMHLQTYQARKDDAKPEEAAAAFNTGLSLLRQSHDEARRLISGLRPPVLDESGVVQAISHLVHEELCEGGPTIDFHTMVEFDRLAPALENAIYRICQEALTNAMQHSGAQKVLVSLVQLKNRLRIEVRDWGAGFDIKAAAKGRFGLEGIRQRAKMIGGKCNIRSKAGQGTRVIVELPVVERQEE